jgi:hypothetical protein
MVLACENVATVVSGRDGSKPFSARMSRKMTLSSRRVAADFWGCDDACWNVCNGEMTCIHYVLYTRESM